ncbi:MAG: acetate--CoA ligase family protein [Pseudomonadota bacterium]
MRPPGQNSKDQRGLQLVAVTQGKFLAQHLAQAANQRGLRLEQVICTNDDEPTAWHEYVVQKQKLKNSSLVLLLLHHPINLSQLVEATSQEQNVLVCFVGDGKLPNTAPTKEKKTLPELGPQQVAQALGWPTLNTPEELIESAWLLKNGLRPNSGQILVLASSLDQAALLDDAVATASLSCTEISPKQRKKFQLQKHGVVNIYEPGEINILSKLVAELSRQYIFDCVVAGDSLLEISSAYQFLTFPPTTDKKESANQTTLNSLASLLACYRNRDKQHSHASASSKKAAIEILDKHKPFLGELQAKALLTCYGLTAPSEKLVGSASAANEAANRLGFPVAIKAIGPQLVGRSELSAVALNLENGASVRQAFRNVLHACARTKPRPLLDGVLVSTMVPLDEYLDCAVHCVKGIALLQARRCLASGRPLMSLILKCPISDDQARESASLLFSKSPSPSSTQLGRLADFLSRLSQVGADLTGRIIWLHLDTVSLPTDETQALVIDARGVQKHVTGF